MYYWWKEVGAPWRKKLEVENLTHLLRSWERFSAFYLNTEINCEILLFNADYFFLITAGESEFSELVDSCSAMSALSNPVGSLCAHFYVGYEKMLKPFM